MNGIYMLLGVSMAFAAGFLMGQVKRAYAGAEYLQEGQTVSQDGVQTQGADWEEVSEEARVQILPCQGKVYAPAAGKIVRIFPTGNAMILRTETGSELTIRAGKGTEALEGDYYRARVLKNEVVEKGKLLLEYDAEQIRKAGFDPTVTVRIDEL